MKKIVLILLVVVSFSTTTYGQSKWHEKQNNYFVEQAGKEFGLKNDQKKELKEKRMEMIMSFVNSNKALKNGELTKEQQKEKRREASKKFNSYFSQLVGKPYAEVEPFLKRMRDEIKNLK
ncbi:hypothetical protein [Flavivirga rizhaonensis]|uniref:DUF4890 domain-containing protein n=1 Tax=Flavivirga rizhaonensis TaxID=2559571 RepID=A0A4S1DVJ6_9FLAO|nr:hypothetical protein [Flavivirga rizhaonensis]TGV01885.1 hypothetical protein EM932_13715 [Flavivirga rizhaonensis]